MFLVRDVFELKFGKAKDFIALYSANIETMEKQGHILDKMYSNYTGKYYTFVMEHEVESINEYEETLNKSFQDKEYESFYAKLLPLIETGHREILKVVNLKKK